MPDSNEGTTNQATVDSDPANNSALHGPDHYDDGPSCSFPATADGLTYVSPPATYLPANQQLGVALPDDVVFAMPLFSGTFLFLPLAGPAGVGVPPPALDANKCWVQTVTASGDITASYNAASPVKGVCQEMSKRLAWAQWRLWYLYNTDPAYQLTPGTPNVRKPAAAFTTWVQKTLKITSLHSLRTGNSLHALGGAIDVGTNSPFICLPMLNGRDVQTFSKDGDPKDASFDGHYGYFAGDSANRDPTSSAHVKMTGWISDNAYEPAYAALVRASLLSTGNLPNMQVAAATGGSMPSEQPYEYDDNKSTNHVYLAAALAAWDRLSAVDKAWQSYAAVTSSAAFAALVQASPLAATYPIDDDLLALAKSNTAGPVSTTIYTPTVEPFAPVNQKTGKPSDFPFPRARRKRTQVALSDMQNDAATSSAAFLQQQRDLQVIKAIFVNGSLSAQAPGQPPGTPLQPSGTTIPCAWPAGWNVVVPASRDVTKGFLGVPRALVRVLASAGLTWLGGTGDAAGQPIEQFTGDIMHFDIRIITNAGSADLDAWAAQNRTRKGWASEMDQIKTLVSAVRQKSAAGLKYATLPARERGDKEPGDLLPVFDAALTTVAAQSTPPDGLSDFQTIVGQMKQSVQSLESARAAVVAGLASLNSVTLPTLVQQTALMLKQAFTSAAQADCDAVLASAQALTPPDASTIPDATFPTKYATARRAANATAAMVTKMASGKLNIPTLTKGSASLNTAVSGAVTASNTVAASSPSPPASVP